MWSCPTKVTPLWPLHSYPGYAACLCVLSCECDKFLTHQGFKVHTYVLTS